MPPKAAEARRQHALELKNLTDLERALWPNIMLVEVEYWFRATANQARRILAGAEPQNQETDAALYAFALRCFLRAVELAAETIPAAVPDVSAALDKFNAASPQVKDARDILDHFDEYKIGDGKLQRAVAKPPLWTSNRFYGRRPGEYTLNLGGQYAVEVGPTFDAAEVMYNAVADALVLLI